MSELPLLPPLDDYCRTTCLEPRCDANRDCGMLKFRRRNEVQERLNDIAAYLANRHVTVRQSSLVQRFFLDERRRHGLHEAGIRYLNQTFSRLLGDQLLRDNRFVHQRLPDGDVAWALRGALVARPDAQPAVGRARDPDVAAVEARILEADRPIAIHDVLDDEMTPGERAAREEGLAGTLRYRPDIRCVFIDQHRGIGTHWAGVAWLRAHLPSDVQLWPIPDEAFRAQPSGTDQPAIDKEAPLPPWAESFLPEDQENSLCTQLYTAQLDDVVSGSLLLVPEDFRFFPAQPNPLAVELVDEDGCIHYALVVTRDGGRELWGLQDLFLFEGGTGLRLRFRVTAVPWRFRTETQGVSPEARAAAEADESLARRVWRQLLDGDWIGLDELATRVQAEPTRVRAVLEAHRCFEPQDGTLSEWRLDRTQPGLRPYRGAKVAGPEGQELLALLTGLVAETRAMRTALDHLTVDLDEIEQRVARLGDAR